MKGEKVFKGLFEKKKENKVLESFRNIIDADDPDFYWLEVEFIKKIARTEPEEFKNLVNLFVSLGEETIDEIEDKLELAKILSDLDYEPVKKFLIRVISIPGENVPREPYSFGHTQRDNKVKAAGILVKMNDKRGRWFIEEFVNNASEIEKDLVIEVLVGADNKMAVELLEDLIKKDEYIGTKIKFEDV